MRQARWVDLPLVAAVVLALFRAFIARGSNDCLLLALEAMAELFLFLEGGTLESSLLSSSTKNVSNNDAISQNELHSKNVMAL